MWTPCCMVLYKPFNCMNHAIYWIICVLYIYTSNVVTLCLWGGNTPSAYFLEVWRNQASEKIHMHIKHEFKIRIFKAADFYVVMWKKSKLRHNVMQTMRKIFTKNKFSLFQYVIRNNSSGTNKKVYSSVCAQCLPSTRYIIHTLCFSRPLVVLHHVLSEKLLFCLSFKDEWVRF